MSFLSRLPKKVKWIAAAMGILLVGAFAAYITSPLAKNRVPSEFNDSRYLAASVAGGIVDMLHETSTNLQKIQELEQEQKGFRALDIVSAELKKTTDISNKATQLATYLETMARQIPGISPNTAAQSALVAISSETALINQLLVYNNNLSRLMLLLQDRYMGKGARLEDINKVVDEINQGVESINSLNTQFGQVMEGFDAYYK